MEGQKTGYAQLLLALFGLVLYVLVVVSDIYVAFLYAQQAEYVWMSLTLLCMYLPRAIFFLDILTEDIRRAYLVSQVRAKQKGVCHPCLSCIHGIASIPPVEFLILLPGSFEVITLVGHFGYIIFICKHLRIKQSGDHGAKTEVFQMMLVTVTVLQAAFGAAPQFILQLYVIFRFGLSFRGLRESTNMPGPISHRTIPPSVKISEGTNISKYRSVLPTVSKQTPTDQTFGIMKRNTALPRAVSRNSTTFRILNKTLSINRTIHQSVTPFGIMNQTTSAQGTIPLSATTLRISDQNISLNQTILHSCGISGMTEMIRVLEITASILFIAWAVSKIYFYNAQFNIAEKCMYEVLPYTAASRATQMLWRTFMVTPRLLALALFASCYGLLFLCFPIFHSTVIYIIQTIVHAKGRLSLPRCTRIKSTLISNLDLIFGYILNTQTSKPDTIQYLAGTVMYVVMGLHYVLLYLENMTMVLLVCTKSCPYLCQFGQGWHCQAALAAILGMPLFGSIFFCLFQYQVKKHLKKCKKVSVTDTLIELKVVYPQF